MAATFNPEIAFLFGKSIGEEARHRKKTILLAPGVNIYRSPLNGRNFEYMGAYNKFRGEHCCHSDILLNKILKQDWKFDGVVVSDWGGVHNTDEAVNNGLDIEMGTYTNGLTTQGHFPFSSYYLADQFLKGIV